MLKRLSFMLAAVWSSTVIAEDSSLTVTVNTDTAPYLDFSEIDTWQPEGYAPNRIPNCPDGLVTAFSGTEVGDGSASSANAEIAGYIANDRADEDLRKKINAANHACNLIPDTFFSFFTLSSTISRYSGAACEFIFDGQRSYNCYQQKAQSYNCCVEPLLDQPSTGGGQLASKDF